MAPWIESLAGALVAALGVLLGLGSSRLRKPYWTIGYFIPLAIIVLFAVGNRVPRLTLIPPFSWLMLGRTKFAILGLVTTMILTTPLSRLPQKRVRFLVTVMMAIIALKFSVWSYLCPAFNRSELERMRTTIDSDGICRQSNDYTCGAAAAVTGLRRLGFPAEEGEIAILAHTSPAIGTIADILADGLQERYGKDGLRAEYRVFKSVDELPKGEPTLAVVKFTFMVDHFVTVLEVIDNSVIIGDPLNGRTTLTRGEFEKKWRFTGVTLKHLP